jgi:separase
MFQESNFFADQAEKVASAVGAGSLILDNQTNRAEVWANSGRADKAQDVLLAGDLTSSQRHLGVASFHLASATLHRANGELEEEFTAYEKSESLLQGLSQTSFIQHLDKLVNVEDSLADQLSGMQLDAPDLKTAKPARQPRGRKPAAKPASKPLTRTARKTPASKSQPAPSSMADECTPLSQIFGDILRRKAIVMLLQHKLALAVGHLEKAECFQIGQQGTLQHQLVTFKTLLAQSLKEVATDFTFNTLPESTISVPALGKADHKLSEVAHARSSLLSPAARRTSLLAANARGKGAVKEHFGVTLLKARDCLADIHSMALQRGSNSVLYEVSRALSFLTVVLSAVNCGLIKGSLHPLYVAYWSELPKQHALLLEQAAIEEDRVILSREDLLTWPEFKSKDKLAHPSAAQFQREYIDIIPESWTAISMSLSENLEELYITRYQAGQSPFILRLPMARHNSRDMDEEVFGFEDGKRDLLEVIELSDFSTHSGRDMEAKGAKAEWWAEREALDSRLRDLLVNIENIWLGGFRGIFSQHLRQPSLLARFQKTLQNILNRHLPSRQARGQQNKLNFDPRILELFIGLGDANDEELDLDEPLIDLLYFAVDILQFNGERNAYDEIDFDAMVIETLDALRAYYSSSQKVSTEQTHTILILDKNLHAFPWESLPSLQALSISRLPSLAALRERLCTARARATDSDQNPKSGHHIYANAGGASILNPSGDLTHTQKTLRPRLDSTEGPWEHITARAPDEKEFESALRSKSLLLYFGHGSGAQYIRSRTVKKLYNGHGAAASFSSSNTKDTDAKEARPGCATALLFGCSSAMMNEHGIYEPSGMLAAYMAAGAPAVLGMLWDVTDKDCDRFAVRVGEIWGLWPEPSSSTSDASSSANGKGKASGISGKVRKLVKDVEKGRGASVGRGKGKKVETGVGAEVEGARRRGVGLDEAVRGAREACVLRYLNGAAAVVYGIPVFLE